MNNHVYPLSCFLPCWEWLRSYELRYLQRDVIAGATLAAYLIPVGIAYSSLAGLPPQSGLYSCIFAGLGFAPFCTSRHTAIAVTSAVSLLLANTLGGLAGGDPVRYAALASETALFVGIICFVSWIAKAGAVIHFMSDTVLTGYKAGAALVIASTQLPKLLGLPAEGHNFFVRSVSFFIPCVGSKPRKRYGGNHSLGVTYSRGMALSTSTDRTDRGNGVDRCRIIRRL